MAKELCKYCGKEFDLPRRYGRLKSGDGFCCSFECWNNYWNNILAKEGKTDYIVCKNCGCKSLRVYGGEFCSINCCTTHRNNKMIDEGTHNFTEPGFHEYVLDCQIKKGLHPFQSGNMDEDALKRKAIGISKARQLEAESGIHIWQRLDTRINNEWSRSLSVAESRGLTEIYLYISDCEYENRFKIGWTYDTYCRSLDTRTHDLSNLEVIKVGSPEFIINLERDIKVKFKDEKFYKEFHVTEMFDESLRSEILLFVENYNG